MKKLLTILLAITLIASLCLTVSAAAGINDAEQSVLTKLKTVEKLGVNGATFSIPAAYINAAENYFLTIDMTKDQADKIIAMLDQAIAVIKAAAAKTTETGTYKLTSMDNDSKKTVLQLGQDACDLVGASLVYDAARNVVTITEKSSGKLLFENTPLVKTTGEDISVTTVLAGTFVTLAVLGSAAALFVVAKKNGLLVK